jgi:hypothetical protein
MKLNQNNDITLYRGETGAIDFKISQRTDYYVPFLLSSARVNPMACITIGSTRRESKNIVSKQLWIDLSNLPRFSQTVVTDLGIIDATAEANLAATMTTGIMYQFKRATEVAAGNPQLHFAYEPVDGTVLIDDYHFTIILAVDETITLDMTNSEYLYQIEVMDTELMIPHIVAVLTANPHLINRLPSDFVNDSTGVNQYLAQCISVITKAFPNHWGYRVSDPYTSPVASVSNIQMIQAPRKFTVQAVVK